MEQTGETTQENMQEVEDLFDTMRRRVDETNSTLSDQEYMATEYIFADVNSINSAIEKAASGTSKQ